MRLKANKVRSEWGVQVRLMTSLKPKGVEPHETMAGTQPHSPGMPIEHPQSHHQSDQPLGAGGRKRIGFPECQLMDDAALLVGRLFRAPLDSSASSL